jgi:glycosyltransferase involved in cell wall biosynthesis
VIDDAARVLTFNDDERAVRIDHGVDASRFASGDFSRARKRWPELGEAPVIAVVGRIDAWKNQLLAVRAFARGAPPDHRLALAGAAMDADYRALVEREARALGVADRMHVLGNLDPAVEVPDLLARAQMVLVPSLHEAFGLVVLESWAASRPVVFTRRGGLADLARALGGGAAASVPTPDEHAWAERIRLFATSARAREEAAAAGAELVRSRFRWDVVVKRLSGIYLEVLEEHEARARLASARSTRR